MRQTSVEEIGLERFRKASFGSCFWLSWNKSSRGCDQCEGIKPCYSVPRGAGRALVGLERILRIHFLQNWFNLSDAAAEEAQYDSRAMWQFDGMALGREPGPDEATVSKWKPRTWATARSGRSMRAWPRMA